MTATASLEETLARSLAHEDAKVRKAAGKDWAARASAPLQAAVKARLKAGIGKKYESDVLKMLVGLADDLAGLEPKVAFDVAKLAGHLSRICERGQSYALTHDPAFAREYFPKCLDEEKNALNLYDHDIDFAELPPVLIEMLPELRKKLAFEELFFHGVPLTSLPPGLKSLAPTLKRLNLNFTDFVELPDVIWELTALEELDMYIHPLIDIPEKIGSLEKLKKLSLGHTKAKALPKAIFSLPLESFSCFQMPFKSIEGIGGLTKLRDLDLRLKKLTALPAEIGKLQNLEELNLFTCEKLTSLPDEVFALPKLKKLDISWTKIPLASVKSKLRSGIELSAMGVS